MHERLVPPQEEAGGVANTAYAGNGDVARPHDLKYWRRKTKAEDLKNAKVFLQKDVLTAEGIEQFDACKEDILRSIRSVMLIGREHWATVNRLIATRLDEDVYQSVASFIPDNYGELEELNPAELLQNI